MGTAQEMPDSLSGSFELFKHKLTRTFLVQTNDKNDGALVVTAAVGIPRMHQIYTTANEYHLYARCREITAERLQPGALYWKVTAKYSTPEPYGKEGSRRETEGQDNNPLLTIPAAESHFETFSEPLYWIYNTVTEVIEPCKASNGQVYDPSPSRMSSHLVLSITRNESVLSAHPDTAMVYMNSVNSDVFWGAAAGKVRITNIVVTRENKQLASGIQFPYLKVVYHFIFKPTHDLLILDSGTFFRTSMLPGAKKIKFITDDGHPCQGALQNGDKLPDGAIPVWNTFRVYPRLPFAALELPQNFVQCN